MSATLRKFRRRPAVCFGVIAAATVPAFLLLIGPPTAIAQFSGLGSSGASKKAGVGLPASDLFCAGNKCSGQTCDEVNDACVGNVTLQAPMGAPLIGLKKKERLRFEAGKVLFGKTFVAEDGLGPVFNKDSCGGCHSTPLGGSGTITVRFRKGLPDTFRDEAEVVVEGAMGADGNVEAHTLLAKCPSKYEVELEADPDA